MQDFTKNNHKLFFIKLYSNLINSPEMEQISMMPDGHMIFSLYIRLIDYARGSKTGILETEINGVKYPDSIKKLKLALKFYSELEIETSLKILINFGFISIHQSGAFVLEKYNMIGSAEETKWAIYKRLERQSKQEQAHIKQIGQLDKQLENVQSVV